MSASSNAMPALTELITQDGYTFLPNPYRSAGNTFEELVEELSHCIGGADNDFPFGKTNYFADALSRLEKFNFQGDMTADEKNLDDAPKKTDAIALYSNSHILHSILTCEDAGIAHLYFNSSLRKHLTADTAHELFVNVRHTDHRFNCLHIIARFYEKSFHIYLQALINIFGKDKALVLIKKLAEEQDPLIKKLPEDVTMNPLLKQLLRDARTCPEKLLAPRDEKADHALPQPTASMTAAGSGRAAATQPAGMQTDLKEIDSLSAIKNQLFHAVMTPNTEAFIKAMLLLRAERNQEKVKMIFCDPIFNHRKLAFHVFSSPNNAYLATHFIQFLTSMEYPGLIYAALTDLNSERDNCLHLIARTDNEARLKFYMVDLCVSNLDQGLNLIRILAKATNAQNKTPSQSATDPAVAQHLAMAEKDPRVVLETLLAKAHLQLITSQQTTPLAAASQQPDSKSTSLPHQSTAIALSNLHFAAAAPFPTQQFMGTHLSQPVQQFAEQHPPQPAQQFAGASPQQVLPVAGTSRFGTPYYVQLVPMPIAQSHHLVFSQQAAGAAPTYTPTPPTTAAQGNPAGAPVRMFNIQLPQTIRLLGPRVQFAYPMNLQQNSAAKKLTYRK